MQKLLLQGNHSIFHQMWNPSPTDLDLCTLTLTIHVPGHNPLHTQAEYLMQTKKSYIFKLFIIVAGVEFVCVCGGWNQPFDTIYKCLTVSWQWRHILAGLICFSQPEKRAPPPLGTSTCVGSGEGAQAPPPAAGGPLQPNERGNLLASARRFSPHNQATKRVIMPRPTRRGFASNFAFSFSVYSPSLLSLMGASPSSMLIGFNNVHFG